MKTIASGCISRTDVFQLGHCSRPSSTDNTTAKNGRGGCRIHSTLVSIPIMLPTSRRSRERVIGSVGYILPPTECCVLFDRIKACHATPLAEPSDPSSLRRSYPASWPKPATCLLACRRQTALHAKGKPVATHGSS